MRLLSMFVLTVVAAACPQLALAQPSLDELLARPVSPGNIALLLPHVRDDERARDRLVAALQDARAPVRATAARVAFVQGLLPLRDALAGALANETDPSAGLELIRGLLLFGHGTGDEVLLKRAAELGVGSDAMELRARLRGIAGLSPEVLDGISRETLEILTRGGSERLDDVAAVLLSAPGAPGWGELLGLAPPPALSEDVLVRAVRHGEADVRSLTFRHLAAADVAPGAGLRQALADTPEARDEGAVLDVFAYDILARVHGLPRPRLRDWATRLAEVRHAGTASAWLRPAIARALDRKERRALSRVLYRGKHDDALDRLHDGKTLAVTPSKGVPLRLVSGLPSGLLSDLMSVQGCRPGELTAGIAEATYAPDGRPRHIGIGELSGSAACQLVMRAMFMMTLAHRWNDDDPQRRPVLVARLDETTAECLDAPDIGMPGGTDAGARRPGGEIEEPRKVRNVAPRYPESARSARRQGVVVLDATISRRGCIQALDVQFGPDPSLVVEAFKAVAGWRYSPTTLDGVPVPVRMTVTVNFRLH